MLKDFEGRSSDPIDVPFPLDPNEHQHSVIWEINSGGSQHILQLLGTEQRLRFTYFAIIREHVNNSEYFRFLY
jgi:hypothetical protein